MYRANLLALFLVMGCVSRQASAPPNMPTPQTPIPQTPIAAVHETVPEVPEPEARVYVRPFVPCVPVTDCRIVARHPLASGFAQSRGFYESPAGQVASRHVQWETPGRAADTFFIEVTESCWVEANYYVESGAQIWLLASEELLPIEVEHNARRFTPVGHSLFDDGTRIFERWEILGDEDVDRATFHVCSAVPENLMSETFYPVAEDSRGLFGYGEHGDVGRAQL